MWAIEVLMQVKKAIIRLTKTPDIPTLGVAKREEKSWRSQQHQKAWKTMEEN